MTSSEPTIVIGLSSFKARNFAASANPACPAPTITNLPATCRSPTCSLCWSNGVSPHRRPVNRSCYRTLAVTASEQSLVQRRKSADARHFIDLFQNDSGKEE
jgi:hypothetical protein